MIAGVVELSHILKDHVDVVVKAHQGATKLLVSLHDDPYPEADALVDEF